MTWSTKDDNAFHFCKYLLINQVILAHHENTKRIFVYTEAYNTVGSGMMTEVPCCEVSTLQDKQSHAPLAFLYYHFSHA